MRRHEQPWWGSSARSIRRFLPATSPPIACSSKTASARWSRRRARPISSSLTAEPPSLPPVFAAEAKTARRAAQAGDRVAPGAPSPKQSARSQAAGRPEAVDQARAATKPELVAKGKSRQRHGLDRGHHRGRRARPRRTPRRPKGSRSSRAPRNRSRCWCQVRAAAGRRRRIDEPERPAAKKAEQRHLAIDRGARRGRQGSSDCSAGVWSCHREWPPRPDDRAAPRRRTRSCRRGAADGTDPVRRGRRRAGDGRGARSRGRAAAAGRSAGRDRPRHRDTRPRERAATTAGRRTTPNPKSTWKTTSPCRRRRRATARSTATARLMATAAALAPISWSAVAIAALRVRAANASARPRRRDRPRSSPILAAPRRRVPSTASPGAERAWRHGRRHDLPHHLRGACWLARAGRASGPGRKASSISTRCSARARRS